MDQLEFVDSHHHLWDLEKNRYTWLENDTDQNIKSWIGDYSKLCRNYLIDNYLSDAESSGLRKSVHIQAGWSSLDPIGETKWLQSVADLNGFPNAIIAEVDLKQIDVERQLDLHSEFPNFRGVRMLPMTGLANDLAFIRGFRALSHRSLTYDVNTKIPYMQEVVDIARQFPDTYIAIGNTGNPMEDNDEYFNKWCQEISVLSKMPNVYLKISGLGMCNHSWTINSIKRWILTGINLFGTSRIMFGTNWPVDSLYSSFQHLIESYRFITSQFNTSERIEMYSSNAEQFYRI